MKFRRNILHFREKRRIEQAASESASPFAFGQSLCEDEHENFQFGCLNVKLSMPPIRVLVVEDDCIFRQFLCSVLQKQLSTPSICEVEDGLAAVQEAGALQPDLVLLDIGLPNLNGIEVAKRIRTSCPQSKILFVSEEWDADIREAALDTGAEGYVVKFSAGVDLPSVLNAVLLGRAS